MNVFKNIFKKKETNILLGRWTRINDLSKSIYANSDNCGSTICGKPNEVKRIINSQRKIKLPKNNNFHYNDPLCCMILGINGHCGCKLILP
jgi:hypothetical protein